MRPTLINDVMTRLHEIHELGTPNIPEDELDATKIYLLGEISGELHKLNTFLDNFARTYFGDNWEY